MATSWNSKLQVLKETKTEQQRHVPVHPVLARLLAEWRLSGGAQEFGRPPTADDFIVPSHRRNQDGSFKHRHSTKTWEQLQADCATVGIRGRRVHDARRTFVSLLQLDGAAPAKVRLISHGPEGSVIGDYTTLPWSDLCAQVSLLRIGLRGAAEVRAPPVAVGAQEGRSEAGADEDELPGGGLPGESSVPRGVRQAGGLGRHSLPSPPETPGRWAEMVPGSPAQPGSNPALGTLGCGAA